MGQTKHGKSWIARHISDPYVQKAQKLGYRSRAAFKLLEIQEKDKIFRPAMTVVDLGAAPGGWSQIVAKIVGNKGKVISLDILEMAPLPGVCFLKGDFTQNISLAALERTLESQEIDWVISDMAPNLSGMTAVDQPKMMILADLAWDFARKNLKKEGGFLVKVFQGEGFDAYVRILRQHFQKVVVRKPEASRSASRELYVLARGYYNR